MAKPAPVAIPTEPIGSIPTYCLSSFIDLNNLALSQISPVERGHIGVRSCAGNGLDTLRPPEELRERSFEPGKNWRWCQGEG
jgi:hypothetical protein